MPATSPARAGEALERLEFVTENGPHVFRVEVADTPEQRSKGLMFRRSIRGCCSISAKKRP
nr:DUF192 domain-containing protein [Methylocystis echinoides]